MFIKRRQVRRSSKFTSKWSRSSLTKREYVASLYTTGVIQLFLAGFLLVGALKTADMMRAQFPDVVWYGKYALTLIMGVLGVIMLRAFYHNLRGAIEIYRSSEPDPRA